MKLIFIYGMPASGKLTISRELEKITKYKVFHNHLTVDLVTSVFEFGSKPFIYLREKIWLDTFRTALESNIDGLTFTFVFEKTVNNDFIEKVENLLENRGELCLVELNCDNEELTKRICKPSRKKFGKISSIKSLNNFLDKNNCLPKLKQKRLTINNTNLSAKKVALKIKEYYKL